MIPTPLRRLVGNWDAKHPRNGTGIGHWANLGEPCDMCEIIQQLQRLLKEMGE